MDFKTIYNLVKLSIFNLLNPNAFNFVNLQN